MLAVWLLIYIVGMPDARYGQEIMACVVLAPDATVDSAELYEYAKDKLAAYKYPRSIEFLDELPRNATGKILKRELHEREAQKSA